MADYLQYIPVRGDTDYPEQFTLFMTDLDTDMDAVQALAAANAAYIAAIPAIGFQLNDGVALTLGNLPDTSISHTGTNTDINHTGTGDLRLINTSNIIAIGDTYVNLLDNISLNFGDTQNATIRYDLTNTELDITSTNIHLTGEIAINGNLTLPSNDHIYIGIVNNFDLHYNGVNAFVICNTGGLFLDSLVDSGEIALRAHTSVGALYQAIAVGGIDPSVRLYYGGSLKLETTSTGIDFTGTIAVNGIPVYNMIVLDAHQLLTLPVSGPTGFVQFDMSTAGGDAAAAAAAGAKFAILRVNGSCSTSNAAATLTISIRKTGTATSNFASEALVVVPGIGTGGSASSNFADNISQVIVGLDANSDFDYAVVAAGVTAITAQILLVGYYI